MCCQADICHRCCIPFAFLLQFHRCIARHCTQINPKHSQKEAGTNVLTSSGICTGGLACLINQFHPCVRCMPAPLPSLHSSLSVFRRSPAPPVRFARTVPKHRIFVVSARVWVSCCHKRQQWTRALNSFTESCDYSFSHEHGLVFL